MNIVRIKKFVKEHQVAISVVAGVAVGALAVYSHYEGKTLLELPADAIKRLKEIDDLGLGYEVPGEGLFVLKYIPEAS